MAIDIVSFIVKKIIILFVVPSKWGVLTEQFIGEPHHSRNFSLTCSLTAIQGLNLPISINWVFLNGSEVTSYSNRVIQNVSVTYASGSASTLATTCQSLPQTSTMSEIIMKFEPVLNSDGGTYKCQASVQIPWMKDQPQKVIKSVHLTIACKCHMKSKKPIYKSF